MSETLSLQRLDHVAIATRRLDECLDFYCGVLGFQELPRPPFNFRGAWLSNCGLQIHIIEKADESAGPTGQIDTRDNHLAFRVDDMDAAREVLTAHGIQFHEQVNAGQMHQIFIQDPDGHHIELSREAV